VTDLGCIRKRMFNSTGLWNDIVKKNAFLTKDLFSFYSFYSLINLPQWLVWKCFKQLINVRFVSMVYGLMPSIRTQTYF